MPISGAIAADFASFTDACAKAEVSLKGFETGSAKVETALNRMANSLSGTKVIQDATLMAQAVDRIGGVSKLTETELRRVGATAQEASAKMRAMGVEVPPGIQKIADATKNIGTAATGSTSILAGMSRQLVGMFTAGAIIAFGRSVLTAGDNIQKMADQTGVSIENIQKLQYIAGQSGTSIESLVGAVQNLQQRLGDDNSGAAGAMRTLGINAEAFNQLDTYAQLTTLATGIRAIKDPAEQASVAAAIFGKTWKEILPAIKSGMVEVGDQAPLMADATVESLDRVGDAMTRAEQRAVSWGGTVVSWIEKIGFVVGGGAGAEFAIKKWADENDPTGLLRALEKIPPAVTDANTALKLLKPTHNLLTLSGRELKEVEDELTNAVKESIPVNKEAQAEWKKLNDEAYGPLIKATKDQADALQDQADKWRDAERAAFAMGEVARKAEDDAAAATKRTNEDLAKQKKVIDEIAAANRAMGGSFEITRENFAATASGMGADSGVIEQLLKKGYSFQQALLYSKHPDYPPPEHPGPRVPGFYAGVENFAGGPAWVGERGPELLNLPKGSSITPIGGGLTVNVMVSGVFDPATAQTLADVVGRELTKRTGLKFSRT